MQAIILQVLLLMGQVIIFLYFNLQSMITYICNISDFTKNFLFLDSKFDPDFVVIDQNTESLKEYLSREWYESWSQLGN